MRPFGCYPRLTVSPVDSPQRSVQYPFALMLELRSEKGGGPLGSAALEHSKNCREKRPPAPFHGAAFTGKT